MNWLDRAEAKFGRLAIHGLPRIIVGFNALVFVLIKISPSFGGYLTMEPTLIRQGQVWRLVTFLFIPQIGPYVLDWLMLVLYLMYLLFIGGGLEQAMGAFRLNVYYLLGMIGVIAASMLFGPAWAAGMLNATLLFAFARYYPDTIIYFAFILPIKVKWLAWFTAGMLGLGVVGNGWAYTASLVICLLNYVVFFGAEHWQAVRRRGGRSNRQAEFQASIGEAMGAPLHECVVCGRTEHTAPYLDFRVARDGREFCADHLPKPGAVPPPEASPAEEIAPAPKAEL